jgi:hypothetical protein
VPQWVKVLRDEPGRGALIDFVDEGTSPDLFYQTVHHRPMAQGDISRVSADTADATGLLLEAARQGRYDELARDGFGFILDHASNPPLALPVVYADRRVRLFRLPDEERQKAE